LGNCCVQRGSLLIQAGLPISQALLPCRLSRLVQLAPQRCDTLLLG